MSQRISPQALAALQSDPNRIRNICILAHVDHGKTTLSDCLISSNGVISSKLAGKVRYMDSTEEEQAREITMKSSAIALVHFHKEAAAEEVAAPAAGGEGGEAGGSAAAAVAVPAPRTPYLVNLIDSPGHVDFSMDVTTAARLCDGALVVIDSVEGVCIQTHAVLKVAWAEGIRPTLVVNKIDRLITELQLSPLDAFYHLSRIIEQANAIISELYKAELMAGLGQGQGQLTSSAATATTAGAAGSVDADGVAAPGDSTAGGAGSAGSGSGSGSGVHAFDAWAIDVDEKVEAQLFFDPARGNVVFASAIDGWAASLDDFAALHARKLEVSRSALRRAMWGDFYYSAKSKRIVPGNTTAGAAAAAAAKGKPLAVSLFLERLWAVYDAFLVNPDEARAGKILGALGLEGAIPKRELAAKEPRMRLQAVLRTWLPLHEAVMGMVVRKVPAPPASQRRRLSKLWPAGIPLPALPALPPADAADGAGGGSRSRCPIPLRPGMSLEERLARVRHGIETCDPSPDAEVVVYVSKMFAVPKASLPDPAQAYGPGYEPPALPAAAGTAASAPGDGESLSGGSISEHPPFPTAPPATLHATLPSVWWGLDASEGSVGGSGTAGAGADAAATSSSATAASLGLNLNPIGAVSALRREGSTDSSGDAAAVAAASSGSLSSGGAAGGSGADTGDIETLVAFARVFSGVLRPDAPVFVLGPKFDPRRPAADGSAHISQLRGAVDSPLQLYLMMGREVSPIPLASAGAVLGIGGLSAHVLKTATLASTPACVSLAPMTFQTTPLVKVAVEPRFPRDLHAVERGLALLNQADPCVEVTVASNGELQLSALGELHLDRCVKDLETRFARVPVQVSPPIQSFMETIIGAPMPAVGHAVAGHSAAYAATQPTAASVAAAAAAAADGGDDFTAGSSAGQGSGAGTGTGADDAFPASGALSPASATSSGAAGASAAAASASASAAAAGPAAPAGVSYSYYPSTKLWPTAGVTFHVPTATVCAYTPDRALLLRVRALPLPSEFTAFLQAQAPLLRSMATAAEASWQQQRRRGRAVHSGSGAATSAETAATSAVAPFVDFARKARDMFVRACASDAAVAPFYTAASTGAAAAAGVSSGSSAASVGGSAASSGLASPSAGGSKGAAPAGALFDCAWAFGPKECGPNMLCCRPEAQAALASSLGLDLLSGASSAGGDISATSDGVAALPEAEAEALIPSLWHNLGLAGTGDAAATVSSRDLPTNIETLLATLRSSVLQGFQLSSAAGPLCAEPMWGVAFVIEEIRLLKEGGSFASAAATAAAATTAASAAPVTDGSAGASAPSADSGASGAAAAPQLAFAVSSGQAIATMRDACRIAFQAGTPRLVEAMYSCQLTCSGGRGGGTSGEQLGKLYAVLSRRRGRVTAEDVWEGTQTFVISAFLPVAESFGFADDLRKRTSGAATSPQLLFSHWEVLPQDPFFVPTTDEEREAFGDTLHEGQLKNIARQYVDAVRGRKGLPVEKKVVAHAEKQRNLSRKK